MAGARRKPRAECYGMGVAEQTSYIDTRGQSMGQGQEQAKGSVFKGEADPQETTPPVLTLGGGPWQGQEASQGLSVIEENQIRQGAPPVLTIGEGAVHGRDRSQLCLLEGSPLEGRR